MPARSSAPHPDRDPAEHTAALEQAEQAHYAYLITIRMGRRVTRYDDHGCRCDTCRAANADRHREHRARWAARAPQDDHTLEHGTRSTYVNHGGADVAQREANRKRPEST